ncbi:MAG: nucleoside triphosphate pyrophosphohydrolase [Xanthomonadaceae bacterium]|nr:nucleoside triphosphate pyrophosphohydrolase [Xanthomonadaceae bacterium]
MSSPVTRLREIMRQLRDPKRGCPWDLQQDFRTIAPYTIEEAYEVADAIERQDLSALKEELGDLLFQVVFHAQMAQEQGAFDFDDVASAVAEKLLRRHPHVFGDVVIDDAETQTRSWEAIKAQERRQQANGQSVSVLDGIGLALPGLTRAVKLQRRAAQVGFDWDDVEPVFAKLDEEIQELREELANGADAERLEAELGDLLFVVANLARHLGIDPEAALRRANASFERRFRHIERTLAEQGRSPEDATLEEMDALWDEAKRLERAAGSDRERGNR